MSLVWGIVIGFFIGFMVGVQPKVSRVAEAVTDKFMKERGW